MKVDFNNVRRQACFAYDRLCQTLNNAVQPDGSLDLSAEAIQEDMDDLRMTIGTIAMCYEEGDEDVKDVYPKEGMLIFNQEKDDE